MAIATELGQVFGKWEVLNPDAGRSNSGRRLALVRCECGTEELKAMADLKCGRMQSCRPCSSRARTELPKPGQVFGKRTVVNPDAGKTKSNNLLVLVRCECGTSATVTYTALKSGKAGSCNRCALKDPERAARIIEAHTTHGLHRHPLYSVWRNMLDRCYNPGAINYHLYGGRGIKVCYAWHDVAVFVADIEREIGPRPEGTYPTGRPLYTLDRIDNNGNYEPGKVKWSTVKEQQANRRGLRLTPDDVRDIRASAMRPCDAAREYGVDPSTICNIRSRRTWRHVA